MIISCDNGGRISSDKVVTYCTIACYVIKNVAM